MKNSSLGAVALILVLITATSSVLADTVNPGNIAIFNDGQPALAGDVNGNFNELIDQINDHASRVDDIEANGLVLNGVASFVDCNDENQGPDALQDAILGAKGTAGLIVVLAKGACGPIEFEQRRVLIRTGNIGEWVGGPLSIEADDSTPAPAVNVGSGGLFFFGPDPVTIDGNGAEAALRTGPHANIAFLGNVTVIGGAQVQVDIQQSSHFFCPNSCTIGAAADGADGLRLQNSVAFLYTAPGFPSTATLNINSSGTALSLDSSSFQTLELVGGTSTQLNIPNASEVEISNNSDASFGPANVTIGGGRFRITDNSNVSSESLLFDAAETAAWNTPVLLDRGSNLRLNFEDADNIVVTQTGSLEIGVNSNVEAFGVQGVPGSLTMGAGSGSEASVAVSSSAIFNSATFAAESLDVLNATVIFSSNTSFGDDQPAINVSYQGLVADGPDGGALTAFTAVCETGGSAYDNGVDACTP